MRGIAWEDALEWRTWVDQNRSRLETNQRSSSSTSISSQQQDKRQSDVQLNSLQERLAKLQKKLPSQAKQGGKGEQRQQRSRSSP